MKKWSLHGLNQQATTDLKGISTIPTRLQPQHAHTAIYNYIYNIYAAGLHMPGLHFISTFLKYAVTVPYTILYLSIYGHIPYAVWCAAHLIIPHFCSY